NASGGGGRSALWSFSCLQHLDSMTHGKLMNRTHLITGSSGGMIGSAYLRQLYLKKQKEGYDKMYAQSHLKNISKDILNPVAFTLVTNDVFIRYQNFQYGKYTYSKDRAYAFEQRLEKNTDHILGRKKLSDYKKPEQNATIPMMILSPTILNDGRRLLISPQPISYLTNNQPKKPINDNPLIEDIEFTRLFEEQNAHDLKFTSALRMTATFPYILPFVTLPSKPPIHIMDSGLRDNYGTKTSLQFLYSFKDWIEHNTSGVIFVNIRDQKKQADIKNGAHTSIIQRIISPVGNLYGNLFNTQNYNHEQLFQYTQSWFKNKLDIVNFQLKQDDESRISLSFHLTSLEKKRIKNAINKPENKRAAKRLKRLINSRNAE
ncbi:MAG: patatin-like phospholipase family protein, partial [Flavobacteriales bacterium]